MREAISLRIGSAAALALWATATAWRELAAQERREVQLRRLTRIGAAPKCGFIAEFDSDGATVRSDGPAPDALAELEMENRKSGAFVRGVRWRGRSYDMCVERVAGMLRVGATPS